MPERRVARGLATVVLLVAGGGLAACSSPTESYCSALKADRTKLQDLSARSARSGPEGARALGDTVTLLAGLEGRAPDSLAADWDTLVEALRGLSEAVQASGASPSEFGSGKRPAGVTEGQLTAVEQAAAELRATPVQQAGTSIEQQAQDVCKVDLGAGLGTGG